MNEHDLRTLAQLALLDPVYPSPIFPPSPYYRFLKRLSETLKPSLSVVLGVCGGGCCLHLALGNPKGKVVGIDYNYDHDKQIQHIYKACPNFTFWLGDSIEDASKVVKEHGRPQILFIDTVHTFAATIAEFGVWQYLLADNYVVCFDDLLRAEMSGVWDVLPEPKLRLDELHATAEGGFGVVWKE